MKRALAAVAAFAVAAALLGAAAAVAQGDDVRASPATATYTVTRWC